MPSAKPSIWAIRLPTATKRPMSGISPTACSRVPCSTGSTRVSPCGDPRCEECLPISTAEGRVKELRTLLEQFSEESQYFHTPTDSNVGRA
jgi:hypothetical protein